MKDVRKLPLCPLPQIYPTSECQFELVIEIQTSGGQSSRALR